MLSKKIVMKKKYICPNIFCLEQEDDFCEGPLGVSDTTGNSGSNNGGGTGDYPITGGTGDPATKYLNVVSVDNSNDIW